MSNEAWIGDLSAAKEFAVSVNRGHGGPRGGRSGGPSPRGGGNFRGGYAGGHAGGYTVGSGGNAAPRENHAAGRRLATEPPAHFWAPTNVLNNAANQSKRADAARDDYPATRDHGDGGPMDIDTVAETAARVLTPAMWGQPADRAPAPQVPQVSAPQFPQAATMQAPASLGNGATARGDTTRRGAFRVADAGSAAFQPTPLTHERVFSPPSPPRGMYASRHAGNNGDTGYNRAPSSPSPIGMGDSRHADPTGAGTGTGTSYDASLKGAHLLNEHGLLRGTKFGVDQGAQNDPNWQLALTCDRLISHCGTVALAAYQADDMEAGRSLDAVVHACREVKKALHAESHLYDERLVVEARKVLAKTQRIAWPHWIKFYQPVLVTKDGVPKVNDPKSDATKAQVQGQPSPHPQVRPAIVANIDSALTRHTAQGPKLGVGAQGDSGHNIVQGVEQAIPFPGFGATKIQQPTDGAAQQNLPAEKQVGCGSQADTRITAQATQPSATLVDLPEGVYRDGLPLDFGDPKARSIFEDFFQTKRT